MARVAKAFKVKVRYQDDAHEEQLIGVTYGSYSHHAKKKIMTAEDAEQHCLLTLHHIERDEAGDATVYPCVEAKAVSSEPLPLSEVPKVVAVKDFAKEA